MIGCRRDAAAASRNRMRTPSAAWYAASAMPAMISFCSLRLASNAGSPTPGLNCEIASFIDAPFAAAKIRVVPTARVARVPVSGLRRDDACGAHSAAIACLGHRGLLLLVWLSHAVSSPRDPGVETRQ